MTVNSKRIFEIIEEDDEIGLLEYLRTNKIDLTKLRNEKGYTVLHLASFKGNDSIIKILFSMAKDKSLQGKLEAEKYGLVKQWVNFKTLTDEFTALHMASFSGNWKIVKTLLDHGANINAINKDGLNMLHTSAQGDQALMLFYFKQAGLDVNARDNRGSTPLHWACYSK